MSRFFALLACGVLVGCGAAVEEPTSIGDASVDSSTGDASLDASPATCFEAGKVRTSLKECQNDADCIVRSHQSDCCGSFVQVGLHAKHAELFAACEARHRESTPVCDCLAKPTTAEDGVVLKTGSTALVRCTNRTASGGICMTSAP